MRALAASFFADHPELSFAALGAGRNAASLDLTPFGVPVDYRPAERHPELVQQYLTLNHAAFRTLALPAWVLTDLYLLPGALGLLLGPAAWLAPDVRARIAPPPDGRVILAAYLGAPSVEAHAFVGVSLFSFVHGRGAAAWVKALTLKMLRAERLRGVAQSNSPSLRVHTRMGPLRILGAPPGAHELATHSFVYETDLLLEAPWTEAMARNVPARWTSRVPGEDAAQLALLLQRAEAGAELWVEPPGLDAEGNLLVRESSLPGASSGKSVL